MPDGSGLDLLSLTKERSAETEVIVMTAHSTLEVAIEAMRRGAYDFVAKPFGTAELRALVQKAFEKRAIVTENRKLRAIVEKDHPSGMLGDSEPMRRILDLIGRIAKSKSTVLVTGESGVGKERVARCIHEMSDRADKPFLVVNCGAIPEALMESELFRLTTRGPSPGRPHGTSASSAKPTAAPSSSTRSASCPCSSR